jgi:protein TonB
MSHALPALPRLIDPKRVAATSATIVVHVVVVILLLVPPALLPAKIEATTTTSILFVEEKPVLPTDPPPPDKPVEVQHDAPPQQQLAQAATTPVTSAETSPMATAAQEIVPPIAPVDYGPPPTGPMTLQVLQGPAPPYPGAAIRMNITGRVVLRIEVDAHGMPVSGGIERSSGSKLLDKAALAFVLAKWRFKAAEHGGQAIAATALVPIDYVLD